MSQSPTPTLTDRPALERHRLRAQARGFADVLHRIAADEIDERLTEVNRTFTDAVTVSGFPDFWQAERPGARHIADGSVLDVAPASSDLVVHAMAMHWADDPVGQLIQSRRALRPDGLFLGCLLGGETLRELRDVLTTAEVEVTGGLSPRVAPMADLRDLGGLLQRSGFALPVADSFTLDLQYRDLWHLIDDLRAMGETNALAQRHRSACSRHVFTRAADLYATRYGQSDGRIPARFELLFLTGWAPSADQPKPLRPGSAQSRLAEALGTQEILLPGQDNGPDNGSVD